MTKFNKLIWRESPTGKDLISLEGTQAHVHLFDASPSELAALGEAIQEVLAKLEDIAQSTQSERIDK